MRKISHGLALLAVTAWVGGLWAVGYLVTPVLFQTLADRQMAGMLAGKLFTVTAYLGIVCAAYLLAYHYAQFGKQVFRQKTVWVIAAMLLLTLTGQFGIQPVMAELKAQALPDAVMHSVFADRFRVWHGVASTIYLLQSLLGVVLVLRAGAKLPSSA